MLTFGVNAAVVNSNRVLVQRAAALAFAALRFAFELVAQRAKEPHLYLPSLEAEFAGVELAFRLVARLQAAFVGRTVAFVALVALLLLGV